MLVYARNLKKGSDRVGTNLVGMDWDLHLPSLLPSFLLPFLFVLCPTAPSSSAFHPFLLHHMACQEFLRRD